MTFKTFIFKIIKNIKEWGLTFISIISFVWLCIDNREKGTPQLTYWLISLGVALLICLIITIWFNWPKKKCRSSFFPGKGNTKINIIIQKGSVLDQKGIKVIHALNTFETSIDKCEDDSLLHAFLALKEVDKSELDSSITESLCNNNYTSSVIPSPLIEQLTAANMKTTQYELGTVANYKKDFILVAFSKIKDTEGNVEEKNFSQYEKSVDKVFYGLQKGHKGTAINQTYNLGILGFQYNGGLYDSHKKLETMVRSFIKVSRQKPFCETLRICVYGKHSDRIDFDKMQVLLDYITETSMK